MGRTKPTPLSPIRGSTPIIAPEGSETYPEPWNADPNIIVNGTPLSQLAAPQAAGVTKLSSSSPSSSAPVANMTPMVSKVTASPPPMLSPARPVSPQVAVDSDGAFLTARVDAGVKREPSPTPSISRLSPASQSEENTEINKETGVRITKISSKAPTRAATKVLKPKSRKTRATAPADNGIQTNDSPSVNGAPSSTAGSDKENNKAIVQVIVTAKAKNTSSLAQRALQELGIAGDTSRLTRSSTTPAEKRSAPETFARVGKRSVNSARLDGPEDSQSATDSDGTSADQPQVSENPATPISKKRKVSADVSVDAYKEDGNASQSAESSARRTISQGSTNVSSHEDVEMSGTEDAGNNAAASQGTSQNEIILLTCEMKRSQRIVDPNNPTDAALITAAKKDGAEIYDDNAPPLPGAVGRNIGKPDLFENVRFDDSCWDTDTEPFVESYHSYTPFVPGRFERLADGSIRDQKHKLIVRVIETTTGRRMIFRNPPPKDWNNQEAITSLNKRIAQQYRRNSNIRFRRVMTPYCQQERDWILKQLGKDGKPRKGWKTFCTEFNEQFEDKILEGFDEPRQKRTHSSLTKEVERFAKDYKAGNVPVPIADKDKRKVGAAKRKAGADDTADGADPQAKASGAASKGKKRKTI